MSEIDRALKRMAAAITSLEAEIEAAAARDMNAIDEADEATALPELQSERDQLADEVRSLRERAEEDARLRAEAAVAVREALNDLRGVVTQEATANG